MKMTMSSDKWLRTANILHDESERLRAIGDVERADHFATQAATALDLASRRRERVSGQLTPDKQQLP